LADMPSTGTAQDLWEISAIGCLSPKILLDEFPIATHKTEQQREEAVGGSLFFGFFLLAKQKKETRQSRESDQYHLQLNLKSWPLVIVNLGIIGAILND